MWDALVCTHELTTSSPGCQPCIPPSSSLWPDNVPIFLAAVSSHWHTKPLLLARSGCTKDTHRHQMQEHNINLFIPEMAADEGGNGTREGQEQPEGLECSASQFAPVKPQHNELQCILGITGVQLPWAVLWGSVKLAQWEHSGQGGMGTQAAVVPL